MRKLLAITFIGLSMGANAQQDHHYSLWADMPSLMNAAATAVRKEDFSFTANYRGQYLSALAIPHRTNSFAFETKVYDDKIPNGWFGLGVQYTNDETGVTKIATNEAYVPMNYVAVLSPTTYLSVGFKPGFVNRALTSQTQKWDNQWNGITFDQTRDPLELENEKINYFDLGAGMYFQHTIPSGTRFTAGVAANHLTAPDVTFRQLTNQLHRQYVTNARVEIGLRNVRFKLSPQYIGVFQGPFTFHQYGMSLDLTIKEGSRRTLFVQNQSLNLGVHYRTTGYLVTTVVLQLESFGVGMAFDTDFTLGNVATNKMGAVELFLRYAFVKEKRKRFIR
jgi:type IX secretion system PorP/SprF family membrane protein